MNIEEVKKLLENYKPFDETERAFYESVQAFVKRETSDTAFTRKNQAGHITASAFVVNADGSKALLVHHAKLDKWVQPGGHVEGDDESILLAALRESVEETGIENASLYNGELFDIDVHEIPENTKKNEPTHFHYDLRFLIVAPSEKITISDESTAIKWVTPVELAAHPRNSLNRMLKKWVALFPQAKGTEGALP